MTLWAKNSSLTHFIWVLVLVLVLVQVQGTWFYYVERNFEERNLKKKEKRKKIKN